MMAVAPNPELQILRSDRVTGLGERADVEE